MNMKRLLLTALALTLSLTGAMAVTFNAAIYPVESGPDGAAVADLNGDGRPDLICANFGFLNAQPGTPGGWNNTLTVLTNSGHGGFGFNATLTVGTGPVFPVAADLNGDGQADVVCANNTDNTLTVLTNGGGGHFGLKATLPVGLMPQGVVAVDTAGLGRMDLVCANNGTNTLTFLTNDGAGAFSLKTSLAVGSRAFAVTALDADGDGRMDLACTHRYDQALTVLTNTGAGGFVVAATYPVGVSPICVVAGDLNGDGHLDLVSANHGGNSMTVLTNDGHGGFALSATIPGQAGTTQPTSAAVADLNGDGHLDLVRASSGAGAGQWTDTLTVLTNNGRGVFSYDTTLHTGGRVPTVVSADLNADGRPDLVCPNYVDATLTVLLNTTLFPPPVMQGLKFHLDANDVNAGSNPADSAPVTTWRDLSGLGLDATPLFGVAPAYRTNALNGRAGVDFSLSGSDSLATAFTNQLNFTNCTIVMVGNGANTGTHVSISAATVLQEFCIFDKGIQHHSSPFHYVYRSHQAAPAGFYIQAGLFGVKAGQLESFINGVASTTGFVFGQQSPTLDDVADYVPVARQAILGWRNSDAFGNTPVPSENFGGVICEVLVYDRQLSAPEVDAMNLFLANKYGLPVTPIPPVLQVATAAIGTVALRWDSTIGRQYQLQSATNLATPGWLNEGSPINGTGGVLTNTVPASTIPIKFFRLLLLGN